MKKGIFIVVFFLNLVNSAFSQELNIGDVLDTSLCNTVDARRSMYTLRSTRNNNFLNQAWDQIMINTDPNRRILSIQYQKQNVPEGVYNAVLNTFLDYTFNAGCSESATNIVNGILWMVVYNPQNFNGFCWAIADGWIVITVNSDVRPFLP